MLLTVAPPVCVAKYSTTKTTEHTQTHTQTDRQHGTLKLNSVNAVEFKNPANGDTLGPRVRLVYRGKIYAYIFLFI